MAPPCQNVKRVFHKTRGGVQRNLWAVGVPLVVWNQA